MLSMRGRVEGGGEGVMHLECLAPQYTYSESKLFGPVDLFHLYLSDYAFSNQFYFSILLTRMHYENRLTKLMSFGIN